MSHFKAKMCTKFDFRWGSAPDPAGELAALSRPLAVFKGPTSKWSEGKGRGGEGKGRIREKGKEGKRRRGKGREREGGKGRECQTAAYAPDIYSFCRSNFIYVTGAERPHNTGTAVGILYNTKIT